jgi:lysylphosphatidylglycerol synthetase-like protein (DUF2156 family)
MFISFFRVLLGAYGATVLITGVLELLPGNSDSSLSIWQPIILTMMLWTPIAGLAVLCFFAKGWNPRLKWSWVASIGFCIMLTMIMVGYAEGNPLKLPGWYDWVAGYVVFASASGMIAVAIWSNWWPHSTKTTLHA